LTLQRDDRALPTPFARRPVLTDAAARVPLVARHNDALPTDIVACAIIAVFFVTAAYRHLLPTRV